MRSLAEEDKSLQLTPPEREKCVEDLFDAILAGSGKSTVYCDKIKQRLFSESGPKYIKINGSYRRYETEWAIAKILYEIAVTLLPLDVFAKGSRLVKRVVFELI